VRLTFIGKDPDSNPTGSPTVYRTDRASWVVQGWVVTDPAALGQMAQFFRQAERDVDNG
jgi:hypothetical protein